MKSKAMLTLVVESLVNGDKEGANLHFSNYLKTAAHQIVNEYEVVKEYDDYDSYDYDDSPEFDSTEDLDNEVATLNVDGVPVHVTFSGVREVATYNERQTFHSPGYSEIVRYGEIKVSYVEGLSIGGELIFDGISIMENATAEGLMKNLDAYAKELYDAVVETHDIDPLPEKVMQTATPEFCKKAVIEFAKDLQSREGDA